MASMMHPNQIETSPELVKQLLARQFPQIAFLPIAPTPFNGTDNAVYRVGDLYSVRLPIVDWASGNESRMKPWLSWIQPQIEAEVPVPIFYGDPDSDYPYSWAVYPWIDGATVPMGCEDHHVAREIAEFLHQVRAMPTIGAPPAGRSPHVLDADVRTCLAQLTVEDGRDELIAIWGEMMLTPEWTGEDPVWMHGDVAPGNLLFQHRCLIGAIDWSGLGVGDPASDLQVAWNLLSGSARETFRKALNVDSQTWDRARARAFAQASFQLPYYRDTFPILGNQAAHVFSEIRSELGR